MGKGYKHGGANPLNFTVKTYPSETELKADKPKENTIGVITTTTMTSWVFSAKEPTEPEVGMVWISVGTSSTAEFNALKKNSLLVYPLSAKQMIGGELVEVPARSYQGGAWVEWILYLYENGKPSSKWKTVAKAMSAEGGGYGREIPITENDDNVVFAIPNALYAVGMVWLEKKYKLDDFNTLKIIGTVSGNGSATLCIWSNIGTYIDDFIAAQLGLNRITGEQTLSISDLTGEYYVGFKFNTGNNAGSTSVELTLMLCE